jgi:hypothetical protein
MPLLFAMLLLPRRDQCTEPFAADIDITTCRLARFLRKRVNDVDALVERCDVKDSIRVAHADSDFPDARSDRRHRLPVVWVEALLNAAQLKPPNRRAAAGNFRRSAHCEPRLNSIGGSHDCKSREPLIPWQQIAGLRDKVIHEYFGVNLEMVWGVVETELPKLAGALSRLLRP